MRNEQPEENPTEPKPQEHESDAPMDLYTYCHHESGGLTGEALHRYVQRYYGHG